MKDEHTKTEKAKKGQQKRVKWWHAPHTKMEN